jgi:hypothetical protein
MDELIEILARDVPKWNLILSKYKPLRISIATNMDNKQRPLLLPERAVELPIGELLVNYFNSMPYKIILCLACLEEGSELVDNTVACGGPELFKKSQPKGKGKVSKAKIKVEPKVKSEPQDSAVKVLFLEYITIILTVILTVLTLFIEGNRRQLDSNNTPSKQAFLL